MPSVNNTLIGAIRAEATLESGKFVDGAKKIRKEAKQTEVQVKQSFDSMGGSIRGFGTALTAGLSIGLLSSVIRKSLDFATSIKDVAAQAGISTKALQEFRYAASQVGVDQTAADNALQKLNVSMGKAAAGSKPAVAAFKAVGVSLEDIKTKSQTEIFGQIADQMAKQGGAAKNAAAANVIFGDSAAKLNPLLDQGSKGINELSAAAERLGIVLSDQQIQQADETAQKLDDVRRVLAAQIAGVVADNAASIITLSNALAQLTSAVINFLNSNPQLALGIIGALAGGRIAGAGGALVGGLAGAYGGERIARNQELNDNDLPTRIAALNKAKAEYQKAKNIGGAGGSLASTATAKRLREEIEATRRATAASRASRNKAPTGNIAVPEFLAPAPKKDRKPPKAPRDRSDDVTFQFDQELRRAHADVLRAQRQLAGTSDKRARIALELLAADKEMQDAELKDRVRRAERDFAEGKITAGALEEVKAQAQKLQAEYDSANALEKEAILREQQLDRMERADRIEQRKYDNQLEDLRFADEMANNREEHRRIQLAIVDTLYKQKEAHLRALKAELELAGKIEEAADVQAEIDRLPTERAQDQQRATRNTQSPLDSFRQQFGDINDELEQLKVDGIMGAVDALASLTEGWDSFRDAALSAIKQVIAELIRLQLMKMAANLLGSAIGGGLGGGSSVGAGIGPGGIPGASSFSGYVGIGASVPGFATGGGFTVLGNPGIDKNRLSMNGMPIADVSYGEKVSISNDNGKSMSEYHRPVSLTQHFHGPTTRQTALQAGAEARRGIATANRKGAS